MFSSPGPSVAPGGSATSSTLGGGSVAPLSFDCLELCGRTLEKFLHSDSQWPQLQDKLARGNMGKASSFTPIIDMFFFTQKNFSVGPAGLSGLSESDYPSSSLPSAELASLRQMASTRRVPLPAELVEQFGHMQCNCTMGLFPEVHIPGNSL